MTPVTAVAVGDAAQAATRLRASSTHTIGRGWRKG